ARGSRSAMGQLPLHDRTRRRGRVPGEHLGVPGHLLVLPAAIAVYVEIHPVDLPVRRRRGPRGTRLLMRLVAVGHLPCGAVGHAALPGDTGQEVRVVAREGEGATTTDAAGGTGDPDRGDLEVRRITRRHGDNATEHRNRNGMLAAAPSPDHRRALVEKIVVVDGARTPTGSIGGIFTDVP